MDGSLVIRGYEVRDGRARWVATFRTSDDARTWLMGTA